MAIDQASEVVVLLPLLSSWHVTHFHFVLPKKKKKKGKKAEDKGKGEQLPPPTPPLHHPIYTLQLAQMNVLSVCVCVCLWLRVCVCVTQSRAYVMPEKNTLTLVSPWLCQLSFSLSPLALHVCVLLKFLWLADYYFRYPANGMSGVWVSLPRQ